MKIVRAEYGPCIMRTEDPEWRFALAARRVSESWIVALTSDEGVVGYGCSARSPHMGSTMATTEAAMREFLSRLEGRDPMDVEDVVRDMDAQLAGNYHAKAGIDVALYDLAAKSLGLPLYKLLGGKLRESVPILRILAIKSPDKMAENALLLMEKGYRYFKIKLHGEQKEDVDRVRAIRKAVGDDIHLTIDANQSYNAKDAIRALNRMADFDIEIAEQPVPAGDLEGLKLVTDSVPMVVEADESARTLEDVAVLTKGRIVDAITLKAPRFGGIRNTITAARLCESANIRHRLGSAVGSRLLAATSIHLAVALPGVSYACELGEFDRLLDDPFEGIEIVNGSIALPSGAGCGVTPRPGALQNLTRC